jgi:putative Holliday junction resolvase
MAFAKPVLSNDADLLTNLRHFVVNEQIGSIVIGMPHTGNKDLSLDEFKLQLQTEFPDITVEFINEDFSTSDAFELMESIGLSESEQKKQKDSYAALVMLNKYIATQT